MPPEPTERAPTPEGDGLDTTGTGGAPEPQGPEGERPPAKGPGAQGPEGEGPGAQGSDEADAPATAVPPRTGLRALLWGLSPWGPPLAAEEVTRPRRLSVWIGGVLGATVALQVGLVFRFLDLGIFVPELATEGMVKYLPVGFEANAIATFGGLAKILGLVSAILAFVGAHAVAAAYRPRVMKRLGLGRPIMLALYTAAPALAILLVVLPLFDAGVAGAETAAGPVAATATVSLSSFLYAFVVDRTAAGLSKSHPAGVEISRRRLFISAASAVAIVALGITALGQFVTQTGRNIVGSYRELLEGEVTPNDQFYKVQKSFTIPAIDPSTWSMSVGGLVANPRTYTTQELLQMSSKEQFHTLECVSNKVGGGLIGNALWSGVPLKQVLEDAGVQPQATWVEFKSADNYLVGVPLNKAMQDAALLALFMNGERLPADHGFPVRALVPGLYGMMNPKWIDEINLVDREVVGYWQDQGWTNDGRIRLTTILSLIPMDARDGVPTTVGGVAFAGDRTITRVQVSDDDGDSWHEAEIKDRLDDNAWTLWSYEWTPPRSGKVRLTARAWEVVDGVEVVQDAAHMDPFPSGASGYDTYDVMVQA